MRIAICMWYDDHASPYGDIVKKINQFYCDKNGYDLIFSNTRNFPQRKPHWERVPLILSVIDNYDYAVWVDADAFFYIDAPKIEAIIEKHQKDLLFCADVDAKTEEWLRVASGFFIAKNTEKIKSILKEWGYSDYIYEKRDKKWQDQSALRLMISENILNAKNEIGIIPYGEVQNYSGNRTGNIPYVWHMAGVEQKYRINHSGDYLLRLLKEERKSLKGVQLTESALNIITEDILNKKALIYGVGNDSKYWDRICNATFIEQDTIWAEKSGVPSSKIILYQYGTTVNGSFGLTMEQMTAFPKPTKEKYDVIIIDAPTGYNDKCPGRLLPVFWAKSMLNDGGIVYIDDCDRPLEKYAIEKFFKNNRKEYFKERLGLMKIYG
jgi:hypothetical protein